MAYTREWYEDKPTGETDASLIDEEIRYVRQDVAERLLDITGAANMTQDPIIPVEHTNKALFEALEDLDENLGEVNANRTIGWYAGQILAQAGAGDASAQRYVIAGGDGSVTLIAPVILPVGAVVKSVSAVVMSGSVNHTSKIYFRVRNGASQVSSDQIVAYTADADGVVQTADLTGLTIEIAENQHCFFEVELDNNSTDTDKELAIYQFRVNYTHPGVEVR